MRAGTAQAPRRPSKVRTSLSLSPEVEEMLDRRAAEERRSNSNYVEWLIEQDAKRHSEPVNVDA